uniref:Hes family bHLH transcription factor 2, tandem duplicate 2 n=1 Tax=Scophthalmus maximus TaxID=52904 RepID=A0A8D3E3L3_SCOMX
MVQTGAPLNSQRHRPAPSHVKGPAQWLEFPSAPTRRSHINRRLSCSATHFSSAAPRARISRPTKAQQPEANEMSPSITTEANQPLPARSTVAQRKQANELRKTLKPLLEKRRRARINDSLSHLKGIILPLVGKDNARYSKLEKADILEMTVRFLRDLPSTPAKGENHLLNYMGCIESFISHVFGVQLQSLIKLFLRSFPPDSADSYREGYKACLQRVSALLPKTSLDQDACQRVNDFVQQSMSTTVTPTCLNCCAQSSRSFPQIQQKLLSLKSSFSSRPESQSRSSSSSAVAPGRAQPGPQPVSAAMWRPW